MPNQQSWLGFALGRVSAASFAHVCSEEDEFPFRICCKKHGANEDCYKHQTVQDASATDIPESGLRALSQKLSSNQRKVQLARYLPSFAADIGRKTQDASWMSYV